MKTELPNPFFQLGAFHPKTQELNVVVETPKGNRNKFEFDSDLGLFKLGGVLPAGAHFPFDFGYVPSTLGEDGDPLDVLVLMDEPAFTGCLVPSRLVGVIEAEQTERGETVRNDRLIAVAVKSLAHRQLESLEQLVQLQKPAHDAEAGKYKDVKSRESASRVPHSGDILLEEIEHFFISYNTFKGKLFKPLGRFGPDRALRLIEQGVERFRTK